MFEYHRLGGKTIAIVVEHIHPPIPDRRFDWQAFEEGWSGDPEERVAIGHGSSRESAVADLLEQLMDDAP